jgi:hypothetical protein
MLYLDKVGYVALCEVLLWVDPVLLLVVSGLATELVVLVVLRPLEQAGLLHLAHPPLQLFKQVIKGTV